MMRNPLLKKYRCVGLGQLCSWANDLGGPFCVCPRTGVLNAHKGDPTLPYPPPVFDHLLQAFKNWRLALGAFYALTVCMKSWVGHWERKNSHNIEMFVIMYSRSHVTLMWSSPTSVIMLDEAHERTLYTDIAVGLLKKVITDHTRDTTPRPFHCPLLDCLHYAYCR